MSYILWRTDVNPVVLAITATMEELRVAFDAYCAKEYYAFKPELVEEELGKFSLVNAQNDEIYYSRMEDICATEPVYVFVFHENGNYHNEIYCELSNDKDALYETAVDFFKMESRRTEERHIDRMLRNLKREGYYEIPYGECYVCDMQLFTFKPYIE